VHPHCRSLGQAAPPHFPRQHERHRPGLSDVEQIRRLLEVLHGQLLHGATETPVQQGCREPHRKRPPDVHPAEVPERVLAVRTLHQKYHHRAEPLRLAVQLAGGPSVPRGDYLEVDVVLVRVSGLSVGFVSLGNLVAARMTGSNSAF
jgi:hypothetical protein